MTRMLLPALMLAFAVPAAAQQHGGQPQSPTEGFLKQFDADNDGQVTLQEYKEPQIQRIEEQFRYMDKSQDGRLDTGEIEAFAEEMRKRMEQMRQQQGRQ